VGYYIEAPSNLGKVNFFLNNIPGTKEISRPSKYEGDDSPSVLVVVLGNGAFEAAGIAYSSSEFREFTDIGDPRPRRFLLMPREEVKKLNPAAPI